MTAAGRNSELLRRTAHWLMREPELEEEDLTARIEAGAAQRHPAQPGGGRAA
jgi:hypothetical protein